MDCTWCGRGLRPNQDEAISENVDQAWLLGELTLFESAMEDLKHALYHMLHRSLDHDDVMDAVA